MGARPTLTKGCTITGGCRILQWYKETRNLGKVLLGILVREDISETLAGGRTVLVVERWLRKH